MSGTESSAGAIAHAPIERDANNGDIGVLDLVETGEQRKSRDAGKPRNDARIRWHQGVGR